MNATVTTPADAASDPLFGLLRPKRLTAAVDVGANPIDGDPPYKTMLGRRLCTVTGFEPQAVGLAALNARKSDLETYLPYVLGDGGAGTLRLTRAPGMTIAHHCYGSFDLALNCLHWLGRRGTVVARYVDIAKADAATHGAAG